MILSRKFFVTLISTPYSLENLGSCDFAQGLNSVSSNSGSGPSPALLWQHSLLTLLNYLPLLE